MKAKNKNWCLQSQVYHILASGGSYDVELGVKIHINTLRGEGSILKL